MSTLAGLRRFLESPQRRAAETFCERCGQGLPADHGHVADLEGRGLLCVCARCFASVSAESRAAQRAVPRRFLAVPAADISEAAWAALDIPVGIAFFFRNSALGRTVACYPSPAGATESLLPPEAWDRLLRALPAALVPEPDVEALLVRRTHEVGESFVVPIDACYELVGRIRTRWTGFGGGEEGRAAIDAFFTQLRERTGRAEP